MLLILFKTFIKLPALRYSNQTVLVFGYFLLIFIDFHWFSLIFIEISLILHNICENLQREHALTPDFTVKIIELYVATAFTVSKTAKFCCFY